MYHIVTDNFVNQWHLSKALLSSTVYWCGSSIHHVHLAVLLTWIVKHFWQRLILYWIQFAYPTYYGSSFSNETTIMIRNYVIHPHLKIRHYVIHLTTCPLKVSICFDGWTWHVLEIKSSYRIVLSPVFKFTLTTRMSKLL